MATITILAIDGGGIRGAIPAAFLSRLEQETGHRASELFDYIAGTSTGGILALGLGLQRPGQALPYSAADLTALYLNEGRNIFSRNLFHEVAALGEIAGPKYPEDGVDGVLKKYFAGTHLSDARTNLLVTSYETEKRCPFFFRSWQAKVFDSHNFEGWQVARSTSAAPTYFPPFKAKAADGNTYSLIDGGMYANNPAMCAWVEAHNKFPDSEIMIVSLGTGNECKKVSYDDAKGWGLVGWAPHLIDIIFDGVSDTVEVELHELLNSATSETTIDSRPICRAISNRWMMPSAAMSFRCKSSESDSRKETSSRRFATGSLERFRTGERAVSRSFVTETYPRLGPLAIVVAIPLLCGGSCKKPPKVTEGPTISPLLFCSGDPVTFTLRTQNVSNLQLLGTAYPSSPGHVLYTYPQDGGSITRATSFAEWPFDFQGKYDGQTARVSALDPLSWLTLNLQLKSLDQNVWKPPLDLHWPGTVLLGLRTDRRNPQVTTVFCPCPNGTGTCPISRTAADDYANSIQGFQVDLPASLFGSKAKLVAVENCGSGPGSQKVSVFGPFGSATNLMLGVPQSVPNAAPAGTYKLMLASPIEFYIGKSVTYSNDSNGCGFRNMADDCNLTDSSAPLCPGLNALCLKLEVRCD